MWTGFVLFVISFICLPGWGQIDLPFVDTEPEAAPTPSPEELEREREQIRQLTRDMQQRGLTNKITFPASSHPGKAHYERVYKRMLQSPQILQLRVTRTDGSVILGQIENRLVDLNTSVGTFPMQWSEVKQLVSKEEQRQITFQTGEKLVGTLPSMVLQIERNDASFVRIPLTRIQDLSFTQNE